MIRVNLLATERPATKKRAAIAAPTEVQAYALLVLFGGGTLAACGLAWWMKSSAIAELEDGLAKAKQRQAQLQSIKVQVEEFERKKALLDAKVELIETLKRQQAAPVHMLDEISKALPEFLWLTDVEQTGSSVKISGETNGMPAVADFMSNLQDCGWFPSVELGEAKEDNNRLVKFTLTAQFRPVVEKKPDASAETSAPGAAPPPAAKGASS